jgi:hypothetical protein
MIASLREMGGAHVAFTDKFGFQVSGTMKRVKHIYKTIGSKHADFSFRISLVFFNFMCFVLLDLTVGLVSSQLYHGFCARRADVLAE